MQIDPQVKGAASPAVSVCLPVFNGERFITAAIESVLAQTFEDFELIVVDDKSTDRSREIVCDLAQKDKRVKLHCNDNNLGLFANYNKCIQLSTGKYIKLFAQDDLWRTSIIARMVKELEARPAVALVACGREYVNAEGNTISTKAYSDHDREFDGKTAALAMLSKIDNFIGEPCAVMFRRDQVGTGFDAGLPQMGDIDYWTRLLQAGNLLYISEPLCQFRVHHGAQSVRSITGLDYLAEIVALTDRHRSLLVSAGLSDEEIVAGMLTKAIQVTRYAKDELGVDYKHSSFEGVARRPRETGRLFVDALERLSITEPEIARLRSQLDYERSETAKLRGELRTLLSSQSWKVTAGLRHFRKLTASLLGPR